MSFMRFLDRYGARDNARGDFIRNARQDPHFPEPADWPALAAYLESRDVPADLVEAGRSLWRAYAVGRYRLREVRRRAVGKP